MRNTAIESEIPARTVTRPFSFLPAIVHRPLGVYPFSPDPADVGALFVRKLSLTHTEQKQVIWILDPSIYKVLFCQLKYSAFSSAKLVWSGSWQIRNICYLGQKARWKAAHRSAHFHLEERACRRAHSCPAFTVVLCSVRSKLKCPFFVASDMSGFKVVPSPFGLGRFWGWGCRGRGYFPFPCPAL